MQNRNFFKSSQKRPASNSRLDTDSFQISNPKNYNFLSDHFHQNTHSTVQSPIMKMKFQLSPNMSSQDTLNFSSNTYIQEQPSKTIHKSYAQSPEKENKFDTRLNYLAAKKYSIPDARLATEMFQREKNEQVLKHYGSNELVKPLRKLNGKRTGFRADNEEESEHKYQNEPIQFYSQKCIQSNTSEEHTEKYMNLASNYQELQREYETMRQENIRLKNSKEELMNENIRIKRQSSGQINAYSSQIEELKQQIYRMDMERQQFAMNKTGMSSNTNRLGYSREGSVMSARGSVSRQVDNGSVNMFYVQELERQNEQLRRENRRLNEIVMKRLKHSIAE